MHGAAPPPRTPRLYDFELVNGSSPREGRLTVWSLWQYSVCDKAFNDTDAAALCRALGYPGGRAMCCAAYGEERFPRMAVLTVNPQACPPGSPSGCTPITNVTEAWNKVWQGPRAACAEVTIIDLTLPAAAAASGTAARAAADSYSGGGAYVSGFITSWFSPPLVTGPSGQPGLPWFTWDDLAGLDAAAAAAAADGALARASFNWLPAARGNSDCTWLFLTPPGSRLRLNVVYYNYLESRFVSSLNISTAPAEVGSIGSGSAGSGSGFGSASGSVSAVGELAAAAGGGRRQVASISGYPPDLSSYPYTSFWSEVRDQSFEIPHDIAA
ncbi:hypothetical protein HYH02_001819 [Chlamydomonas schloesseri]|uniref:SRCR domain-containing protein n=1 Tax=Chlamydomonas schloesseri TaxID=2026947 RepID=A0A835WVT9_9CHLO|nr:hypothetical protein HYH02_001819 [Chlamydomonas schloesseri]|eukprot:KAG2453601.1 hypothetical protein HYH02_001819 [Chlamydomonas schloesseri]